MKKDFELLIGRKIRGLKEIDLQGKENDMINFVQANETRFTYDPKDNNMSYKNGSFNCSFEVEAFTVFMIAKRLAKVKFEQVKAKKPDVDKWHKRPKVKIKPRQPQPVKRQPKKETFNWSAYICM